MQYVLPDGSMLEVTIKQHIGDLLMTVIIISKPELTCTCMFLYMI